MSFGIILFTILFIEELIDLYSGTKNPLSFIESLYKELGLILNGL